ncbi:MAG: hypothetical protein HC862_31605 [Scytonema sp. RU_4_4]|nr:hypothetical protein [Scytonema sp. RU_4_4]
MAFQIQQRHFLPTASAEPVNTVITNMLQQSMGAARTIFHLNRQFKANR